MGDEEDDDSELEDDDYNPDLDDTGEAGEGARAKKRSKKSSKETFQRRGGAGAPEKRAGKAEAEEVEQAALEAEEAAAEPEVERADPRAAERKARADEMWAKMNGGKAAASAKTSSVLSSILAGHKVAAPKKKSEPSWMAGLAALNPRRDPAAGSSTTAKLAAAEALKKVSNATALVVNKPTDGVVTVKETRRFAGKDIEVEKTYEAGTKAAKEAIKRTATVGGIDAVLQAMEKKRKLSVLDKTKMDWDGVKKTDTTVLEDVEMHKKSGTGYLEQQNFLKDVELREYERERDARLAADPRNRGRL